VAFLYGVG